MNVFAHYARYYDLMYRDKDYQAESAFVHSLIKQYAPEAKAVLELGSGTGAHARHLAEMGFEVHGVDRSEPMLERAQARRHALPPVVASKLSFSHGDVRQIRLGKTFDAVIALFHLISYQVSNEDMAATFRTVSEHLQPGGVLIFDYWYGPTVLTERPSVRVKRVEDETVRLMRVVEPVMHTNKNVVEVNYQFFIQDKRTGVIETFREDHRMRYLFLPGIELFFANAGLMPVDHGDWMTGRAPGFDTWSVYSLGKK